MFKNALHVQILTVIVSLLTRIISSKFQEMLTEASSFLLFKYYNFDFNTPKVLFIRSWPILRRPSQGCLGTGNKGIFFRGTVEQRPKNKGNSNIKSLIDCKIKTG